MELKRTYNVLTSEGIGAFNRTAYGIETYSVALNYN